MDAQGDGPHDATVEPTGTDQRRIGPNDIIEKRPVDQQNNSSTRLSDLLHRLAQLNAIN
jgi:hypothetical protein